jgi:archaellum component FlaC
MGMDFNILQDAKSELENLKETTETLAGEIGDKVDELTTIKDDLSEGVSQVEDYIDALSGLEDTLSSIQGATDEARYHDIG